MEINMKQEGIERVWKNAGTWSDQAMNLLASFSARQREEFTLEDFRLYASMRYLPEPHHDNCWGALFSVASKQFLIKPTGSMVAATRAKAHGRLIRTWVRA
jgi:hypothetical protein